MKEFDPVCSSHISSPIFYREVIEPSDAKGVGDIIASSGFFSAEEIEVAVELVNESLLKGSDGSGYYFLFAESAGKLVGYTCYGPIPFTEKSYDIYWIAVQDEFRGRGLGKELLERTEFLIGSRGGRRIYVETSSRPQYQSTHKFYEVCGYRLDAILKQFYSAHDDKMIYVKVIRLS